jgi:hypothetical protein
MEKLITTAGRLQGGKTMSREPLATVTRHFLNRELLPILGCLALLLVGVSSLQAQSPNVKLRWTAPGDDGSDGTASYYDIRYSTSMDTLLSWEDATQVVGEPLPAPAGQRQSITIAGLQLGTTYFFAIRAADEVLNWSDMSNIVSATPSIVLDIDDEDEVILPTEISLSQNYPNPFNPTTQIQFATNIGGRATVRVYNVLGERVKTLIDKSVSAGRYTITWDGTDEHGQSQTSGVYFYVLTINDVCLKKKMILVK